MKNLGGQKLGLITSCSKFRSRNNSKSNIRWFRRFQYVSVVAIVVILSVACLGLRGIFRNLVLYEAERDATRISRAIRDSEIQQFITTDHNNADLLIVPQKEMAGIDQRMHIFLAPFDIVKIKIFNFETRIIYSTDSKIIGKLDIDNTKLANALSGMTVSKYETKEHVWDLKGEEHYDIGIVETYVPIYNPAGKVIGSFEIYKNVAEDLRIADRVLLRAGVVLLITVLSVFAMLMFVIHRALCATKFHTNALQASNVELQKEITEREQVENVLETVNKQLKATVERLSVTNRELADFAHIIAHDLKSPLRAMGTLSNWILTDYGDRLDEKGREQVELLNKRAIRMSDFIDSILEYSEIRRNDYKKEDVNLKSVVNEIIDDITPPENIKITVEDELPVVVCSRTRIAQVFRNLLDNAIKYMDKPEGQITIRYVEEEDFWKFSVTDNGSGIEKRYFEKIFKVFQILTPRDEVETTGIGLSIAKKIIETYGGRIWLESQPGLGSAFFFTLPKQRKGVEDAKLQANLTG